MPRPLLEKEAAALAALTSAWNDFASMDQTHPDHIKEFRAGIHACQSALIHRLVQREHPEIFPSL